MQSPRPAVFIDRDDTLIATREATALTDHVGDLTDPGLVRLMTGAGEACRDLAKTGAPLVLVTNQGAVARGRATLRIVEDVNDRVRELLAEHGVKLAGVYFCPYHPESKDERWRADHVWRKPQPGMYFQAARELGIDLGTSWSVGDAARDGLSAVTAGLGSSQIIMIGRGPGLWYPDLAAAAAVIVPALTTQMEAYFAVHGTNLKASATAGRPASAA